MELKLLLGMCSQKENAIGRIEFSKGLHSFMAFKDYMEMEEEEYIEFMKVMCRKGYIEYNLGMSQDIKQSSIRVSKTGMEYINDNYGKNKIGF